MTAEERRIEYRRIVVKVGSNLLTAGSDRLNAHVMAGIVEQIAGVRALGAQVILVTSGAIAAGRHRLGDAAVSDRGLPARQVLAAIGQSRLMSVWEELFELRDIVVAQALLTRGDLADRLGYLNARNTLLALLDRGVVPIVNENDVVSIEEIRDSRIGDNDNLSAQVANLVDAELLLILSDVAGLYDRDPRRHPDAALIPRVERIDDAVERVAGGAGIRGTGGMATKVQAARLATQSGAHVVIADGHAEDVVLRATSGEAVGTHFLPTADRMESRRRYLRSGLQSRGRVTVDDGAARALEHDGKSLLPAGVVGVEGDFQRGDVVQVYTQAGRHLASGNANYAASDVERIKGLRSDRIAELLGYDYGEEIVHRNNLVLA